jgi:CubicO group peptidase (beta-lactamase class C family)
VSRRIPPIYLPLLVAGALLLPRPGLNAQRPDTAAYRRASEYSKGERGDAVLVMIDGRVVFEDYHNGGAVNKAHLLASGTKSFTGVMAIAAVEDGLLSLDEPVAQTVPEWANDPQRAAITVRQLLTLTSGLEGGPNGNPPSYGESVTGQMTASPGERFQYGPAPFQVFGEVMKRKLRPLGETVADYMKRRVLDPLGIRTGFWRGMLQGEPQLPHGAYLSAREWAKFGEFIRKQGQWGGKQLLPAGTLAELFRGTTANPAYGVTWWLNEDVPPALRAQIPQLEDNLGGMERVPGLEGMVLAAGAFKQRLYVIPSLRMVVVRFGNSVGKQFDDARFLGLLTGAMR